MRGVIKSVNEKGFGFIAAGAGQPDAFFHRSDLRGGLEFGQQLVELDVEFEPCDTPRGPKAIVVRPAN